MPKEHKAATNDTFGPSLTETTVQMQQSQKKGKSASAKKTKWSPFPIDIKTSSSTTINSSGRNNNKENRHRRRRKNKLEVSSSRCRKPASPFSTCSSDSITSSSSGIGSMGSSALTRINGTHDAISTPTLPLSDCSSVGFNDDKYEDARFSDIVSEVATGESRSDTPNDPDLTAAVSIGFATENFVTPDLTHPIVQQFYQEQRLIYRQFYERQFSTIACIPYANSLNSAYCALTAQLNRCTLQQSNRSRPSKYSSGKNGHRTDSNMRKNRQEQKQRIFYNSSSRSDPKLQLSNTKSAANDDSIQEMQPSCSEQVDSNEIVHPDVIVTRKMTAKDQLEKENLGKRDGNYSSYNRSSLPANNGGSRKQRQFNSNRGNHHNSGYHQYDKKIDIDLKKLLSRLDPLSLQMYEFQKVSEQTTASLCEKIYLRDLIYCTISPHFAGCGLYIVGSTLNGFGSASSDMDLCLMITPRELDQRIDAVLVLTTVMNHMKPLPLVKNMELIFAKVPILRATFHAPFDKITVDLNANNSVAIRNTHLLSYYAGFDWRVRPLVCAIKEWAKRRGINNANQSSLTSYSLVLMAIHYLQCAVEPPILPSLQHHYPDRFTDKIDVLNLSISFPLLPIDGWEYGKNMMSLSDLLKGFFNYYAREFDFDGTAISVRLGRIVERGWVVKQYDERHKKTTSHSSHHHSSLSQWRCICIEEPFTLSNAAHSVYCEVTFTEIKKSFEMAYNELVKNGNLDTLFSMEPIRDLAASLISSEQ